MYKKILLATDGSNHIDQAASIIIGFYKKWDSKIVIFHSIKHMLEKVTPPSHGINAPYTSEAYFTSTPSSKPVLVTDEQDPNITRLSEQEITRIGETILEEKKATDIWLVDGGILGEYRMRLSSKDQEWLKENFKEYKQFYKVIVMKREED